jgi:hypothetical protein
VKSAPEIFLCVFVVAMVLSKPSFPDEESLVAVEAAVVRL